MRRLVVTAALALAAGLAPTADAGPGGAGPTASAYGARTNFTLVGQTTLGNRGVNSPVAVAGGCVYVGDRYDDHGVAVVDARNPARPRQVGTIAPRLNSTQREVRADAGLGLLIVMSYSLFTAEAGNLLEIYDIRSCTKPVLLSTYDFGRRSPHEFFLWKDAKRPGRALVYTAMTIYSPDLEVIDITDPRAPKLAAVFDLGIDGVAKPFDPLTSAGGYLHSISVNDDGTRAYLGTWDYGLYVADTSALATAAPAPVIVPLGVPVSYAGNVHGGVKVPGKNLLVLVEEAYAKAGKGCPFGWLRMADISDERAPTLLGEFKLRENDCARATALNGTFTSHNQTVFPNVALVPWYSGGLRAVDISNPKAPVESGAFVPRPTFEPDARDARLYFGNSPADPWTGAMWSYPVVQNGLIYVVDIDLGLFILRYTGRHAAQVRQAAFVEGNSAPGRYTAKAPVIRRPSLPTLAGRPAVVRSPYFSAKPPAGQRFGFACVI